MNSGELALGISGSHAHNVNHVHDLDLNRQRTVKNGLRCGDKTDCISNTCRERYNTISYGMMARQ